MKQIAFWDAANSRPATLLIPAALLAAPVDSVALDNYRLAHQEQWQPLTP